MTDANLLKNSVLFETLSGNDLNFVLENTEERIYCAGEKLFSAGSPAIHFFLLKAGEVALLKTQEDGSVQELARRSAGESFGEFEFVVSSLYDTDAVAVRDTVCIVFPAFARTLDGLALEQPQTVSLLYLKSLQVLSDRLRSIHSLISENAPWVSYLQDQAYTDKLTGLFTKVFLDEKIPNLLKPPVALIIVKPDHFKELNDSYGHQAGDAVLARLGDMILETIKKRQKGWAVRLRSNETAVLLQESNRDEAVQMANELAAAVGRLSPALRAAFPGEQADHRLTASIVIGMYDGQRQGWRKFFDAAYAFLKKVWEEGGNRICVLKSRMQTEADNETSPA
jgi:diguanylate cyclase